MSGWEYKVVPAPTKGVKGRGVKGPEGRFANALQGVMNEMGATGWEYQRAETLPSTERSGLTGSTTEWRNVLVFRRAVAEPLDDFAPELLPPPDAGPVMAEDAPAEPAQNRTNEGGKEEDGFHKNLTLHHVDVFNRDGATVAEEADEDRKANGGLGGGDGQHEQRKHLPHEVVEERGERHKVDVHREQHQFDAHQQDDHILAVQKQPEDTDDEQRRRNGQVMFKSYHVVPPGLSPLVFAFRFQTGLNSVL